ncbi:hypothetical protein EI94DRAFT_1728805 [Lactarius quietus]|nr:hypothetical protein EI94DRAFT_1728805 [Lactarius quietus]
MDPGQPIVLSTSLLVATRIGLFATCRRFIDRSLYDELKQISQVSPVDTPVELDTLPQPSSAHARMFSNNSFNSVLSKTLFSLCFSESCTLFILLMYQALDHRCIQYPYASTQFPNILLHALAQYHYAYTCIAMCGLYHPIEFRCVAYIYRIKAFHVFCNLQRSPSTAGGSG